MSNRLLPRPSFIDVYRRFKWKRKGTVVRVGVGGKYTLAVQIVLGRDRLKVPVPSQTEG